MARILIVDDESDTIDLMGNWLRLRGYDVISADGGEAALRAAHSERPDLALIDADMPAPDGVETCRRLRAQLETRALPVILITTPDAAAGQLQALRAGATDNVTRPVNLDDLGRRIHVLLGGELSPGERQQSLAGDITQGAVIGLPCEAAWMLATSQDGRSLTVLAAATAPARAIPGLDGADFVFDPDHWLGRSLATHIAEFNQPFDDLSVSLDPVYKACKELGIALICLIPARSGGGQDGLLVLGSSREIDVETEHGQRQIAALALQARAALVVDERPADKAAAAAPEPPAEPAIEELFAPEGEYQIDDRLPVPALDELLDEPPPLDEGGAAPPETAAWPPAVIASLRDAAQAIQSDAGEDALQTILNEAARGLNAGLAVLALKAGRDSAEVVIQAAAGLRAERLEGVRLPVEGTLAGRAMERAELLAADEDNPDGLAESVLALTQADLTTALAAPVGARGEIVGALEVINRRDGLFDEQDADALRTLAALAGLALEQARLRVEAGRQMRELTLLREASAAASTQPVDQALDAKPAQHEPLQQALTSIEDVASLAVQMLKPAADKAQIHLETLYADYLPDVLIDRDRLFLAFENLLSNAIKFSPAGSKVTLTIWDSGPSVQVEVTDRGIGIAPEEQGKIWQRLNQSDGSATPQPGGAGPGLAVVKQVVEQHEGKVWVKSKPGEGSTFAFTIPKAARAGAGVDFVPEF